MRFIFSPFLAVAGFDDANPSQPQMNIGQHLAWSALVILVLAFAGVQLYRKWMYRSDTATGGFTLSDLRKLHREGKMTDQEFETAKAILIGAFKKAEAKAPQPPGPRNPSVGQDPQEP